MTKNDSAVSIKALWLQYRGLTVESAKTFYRVENAAWKTAPPELQDAVPEITGLMIAM